MLASMQTQETEDHRTDRRKLQNRLAQRRFREKKAQEQQWGPVPTRSPSHSRSSSIGDIPPEFLPWLTKLCTVTGLPIPPALSMSSTGVRSLSFNDISDAEVIQSQGQPTVCPLPAIHNVQTRAFEDLGFEDSGTLDVTLHTRQLGLSRCPTCHIRLSSGDRVGCACTVAPQSQTDSFRNPQLDGHNEGYQEPVPGYHDPPVWTTEDIQLLEQINDQPLNDGVLLRMDDPSLSATMEFSKLPPFDSSPHLDYSSNLNGTIQSKQVQTRGSSMDYAMSGNVSSANSSTSSTSHLPPSIKETSPRPLLHVATENGHCNIIQMLINHRVNVNEADSKGITAMHLAVQNRHIGAIRLLLQNGADINIHDCDGQSPLYCAVSIGLEEAVALFLSHGVCGGATDQGD